MNLPYRIGADAILVAHFAFVLFVALSVPVIWIGAALGKRFVRHPAFRLAHLLAMGVVVAQTLLGDLCPLTEWEMALRLKGGGGEVYTGSCIQHWVHRILFYDASERVFAWLYGLFFSAIVLSLVVIPPRWSRRQPPRGKGSRPDCAEKPLPDGGAAVPPCGTPKESGSSLEGPRPRGPLMRAVSAESEPPA